MPITYVGASDSSLGDGSDVSSVSFAHTATAGSNKIFVLLAAFTEATTAEIGVHQTTVPTWNTSENFTLLGNVITSPSGGADPQAEIWYLVNPTVKTDNVVVTLRGNNSVAYCALMEFDGVDQTTPFEADTEHSQVNGSTITKSITTLTNNAFIVEVVTTKREGAIGPTPNSLQTEVFDVALENDPTEDLNASVGYIDAGAAGSKSESWTDLDNGATSDDTVFKLGALKPAAAAATRRVFRVV